MTVDPRVARVDALVSEGLAFYIACLAVGLNRELYDTLKNPPAAAPKLSAADPRHGTLGGYTYHGCRCIDCRQAAAKSRRDARRKADRRRRLTAVPDPEPTAAEAVADAVRAAQAGADWRQHASCRGVDPDLFYPSRGEASTPAKEICGTCPVQDECREYALDNDEKFGIWGGLSEKQRRQLRRTRREAS